MSFVSWLSTTCPFYFPKVHCFKIADIDIIHLQSAHNFREHAFFMLNHPEVLSNLDETGLKFIPVADYEALKQEELEQLREKIALREQEGIEKKLLLSPPKEEFDQMMAHNNLGLEKWCGTCSWSGRVSDSGVGYFNDT